MKNLVFINGTMGVGKTATSKHLQKLLPNCVFLDGDWCWDASPFIVTEETKNMVIENITFLLNRFLECSAYDNILFCWVMHESAICERILEGLRFHSYKLYQVSLICSPGSLRTRLENDINEGLREEEVIQRSLERLANYQDMENYKIDTSTISAEEAAKVIVKMMKECVK